MLDCAADGPRNFTLWPPNVTTQGPADAGGVTGGWGHLLTLVRVRLVLLGVGLSFSLPFFLCLRLWGGVFVVRQFI
jgi:hypothetical protein